ncbi:TPA: hypothetical protein ACMEW0_002044 [Klebsiella quasipneumoniae subsp. quasipneumoniae]
MLYALFYRGALLSGDLPSKSGAAELRELGFAETRRTVTEYQKENHFTFLTAEGQELPLTTWQTHSLATGSKLIAAVKYSSTTHSLVVKFTLRNSKRLSR